MVKHQWDYKVFKALTRWISVSAFCFSMIVGPYAQAQQWKSPPSRLGGSRGEARHDLLAGEGAGDKFHHSLSLNEYISHLNQFKNSTTDIVLKNQISEVLDLMQNRLFFSGPFKKAVTSDQWSVTSKGGNQTDFIYVIGSYQGKEARVNFVMEYRKTVASVKWQVTSKGVINKAVIGDQLSVIGKDALRETSQLQQPGGMVQVGMKFLAQTMVGSGWELTDMQPIRQQRFASLSGWDFIEAFLRSEKKLNLLSWIKIKPQELANTIAALLNAREFLTLSDTFPIQTNSNQSWLIRYPKLGIPGVITVEDSKGIRITYVTSALKDLLDRIQAESQEICQAVTKEIFVHEKQEIENGGVEQHEHVLSSSPVLRKFLRVMNALIETAPNQNSSIISVQGLKDFLEDKVGEATVDQSLESAAMAWSNKGRSLYKDGKVDEALDCYDKALRIKPDLPDVWYGMGIALGKSKRYEESLEAYQRAAELYSKLEQLGKLSSQQKRFYALCYNNQAVDLVNRGDYEKALDMYQKALDLYPEFPLGWDGKGIIMLYDGPQETDVNSYERLFETPSDLSWEWQKKEKDQGLTERYTRILKIIEQRLGSNNNNNNNNNNQKVRSIDKYGRALMTDRLASSEQDLDKALQAYQEIDETDPTYPWAHNNMGIIYYRMKRYDAAVKEFEIAIQWADQKKHPFAMAWYGKSMALYVMGVTEERSGRKQEAQKHFTDSLMACQQASQANERFAWAWNNEGVIHHRLGDYPSALQAFDRAIQRHPKDIFAHVGKAMTLFQLQGKELEARASLRKALLVCNACLEENPNLEALSRFKNLIYEILLKQEEWTLDGVIQKFQQALGTNQKGVEQQELKDKALSAQNQLNQACKNAMDGLVMTKKELRKAVKQLLIATAGQRLSAVQKQIRNAVINTNPSTDQMRNAIQNAELTASIIRDFTAKSLKEAEEKETKDRFQTLTDKLDDANNKLDEANSNLEKMKDALKEVNKKSDEEKEERKEERKKDRKEERKTKRIESILTLIGVIGTIISGGLGLGGLGKSDIAFIITIVFAAATGIWTLLTVILRDKIRSAVRSCSGCVPCLSCLMGFPFIRQVLKASGVKDEDIPKTISELTQEFLQKVISYFQQKESKEEIPDAHAEMLNRLMKIVHQQEGNAWQVIYADEDIPGILTHADQDTIKIWITRGLLVLLIEEQKELGEDGFDELLQQLVFHEVKEFEEGGVKNHDKVLEGKNQDKVRKFLKRLDGRIHAIHDAKTTLEKLKKEGGSSQSPLQELKRLTGNQEYEKGIRQVKKESKKTELETMVKQWIPEITEQMFKEKIGNMGWTYWSSGNHPELLRYLKANPKNTGLYCCVYMCLLELQGKELEAQIFKDFSLALKQDGRYLEAIDLLKKGIKHNLALETELEEMELFRDYVRMRYEEQLDWVRENFQKKLNDLGVANPKTPSCFISYVWEEQTNRWLQDELVPDLDRTGAKVLVAYRELRSGEDLWRYEEQVAETDFALLGTTPEFKKKWESYEDEDQATGIGIEMKYVRARNADIKKKDTTIPLLLSGTKDASFPGPTACIPIYRNYKERYRKPLTYFTETFEIVLTMFFIRQYWQVEKSKMEGVKKTVTDCVSQIKNSVDRELKDTLQHELSTSEKKQVSKWRELKEKERNQVQVRRTHSVPENVPLVSFGIPERNQRFSGRRTYLNEKLKKALPEGKHGVVVLNASERMGKVGKTEIAKEYVYQNWKKYKTIFWIDGSSEETIHKSFGKAASSFMDTHNENIGIKAIKQWLEQPEHGPWLIVLDHVTDSKVLQSARSYLPDTGGHLLITSRWVNWTNEYSVIPVDVFTREESVDFLNFAIQQDDNPAAQKLALLLGDFPFSLNQAAKNIWEQKIQMKNYEALRERELDENGEYLKRVSNVQERNKKFVGREIGLSYLEDLLENEKYGAVSLAAQTGLGGVGKTQIALQYAYRNAKKYRLVWWLNAENANTLYTSYLDLAEKAGIRLAEEDKKKQERVIEKVRHWLEQPGNGKWLLVFDNAESQDILKPYVPRQVGHVIITSRNQYWQDIAEVLPVEVFTLEEAVYYIQKVTGIQDMEKAKELAETLNRLPLALAQASAYVQETGISLDQYLELYGNKRKELQTREHVSKEDHYKYTVQTTWNISMEQIQKEEAEGKKIMPGTSSEVMRLCAYLAANDIPRDLIESYLKERYPDKKLTADLDANETVKLLWKYSMIQADVAKQTISIYPLVQQVLRDELKEEERKNWIKTGAKILNGIILFDENKIETWKESKKYMTHGIKILEHAEQTKTDQIALLLKLYSFVAHYKWSVEGHHALAKKYWLKSLDILKETYSNEENADVAAILHNLGNFLRVQGDYKGAQKYSERALQIYKKVYGTEEHADVAMALSHLALLLRVQGDYKGAQKHAERALEIYKKVYGTEEHVGVANNLNVLGLLAEDQGTYKKVHRYFEQALDIYKKVYGTEDHPNVASILKNFGSALLNQEDYKEAQRYSERALEIFKKVYGTEDHADIPTILNNIGNVFNKQGDYEAAHNYYERALNVTKKVYGTEHVSIGGILNNLGFVFSNQGNYEGAQMYYERALQIYKKVYGREEHVEVAMILSNLGAVLRCKGDYDQARIYYERALEIFKITLNFNHPYIAEITRVLINLQPVLHNARGYEHLKQEKYDLAIRDFQEAIQRAPQEEKDNYYDSLGEAYLFANDLEKAKQALLIVSEKAECIHETRAKLAYANGDYQSAVEQLSFVIQQNPEAVNLIYLRGKSYKNMGKKTEALKDYNLALKLSENKYVPALLAVQNFEAQTSDETDEYLWRDQKGTEYRFYKDTNNNNNNTQLIRVDVTMTDENNNNSIVVRTGLLLHDQYKGDNGTTYSVNQKSQNLSLRQYFEGLIQKGYHFVFNEDAGKVFIEGGGPGGDKADLLLAEIRKVDETVYQALSSEKKQGKGLLWERFVECVVENLQIQSETEQKVWARAWTHGEVGRRKYGEGRVAGEEKDDKTASEKYEEAYFKYQEALDVLKESDIKPILPEVFYGLGILHGKTKKYDQAFTAYKEACQQYRDLLVLYKGHLPPGRERTYILCLNNVSVDTHNKALNGYLYPKGLKGGAGTIKAYKNALETYEEALQTDIDYPIGWDGQGVIFMHQPPKPDQASHERLFSICPNISLAWQTVDIDETQKEHYYLLLQAAREMAKEKKEQFKFIPLTVRYAEALALEKLGNEDEALKKYKDIMKDFPEFSWVYVNLGLIHYKQGKYQKALNEFQNAIDKTKGKKFPFAFYCKALVLSEDQTNKEKNNKEALDAYKTVRDMNGRFPWTWNNEGMIHYRMGEYKEANDCFEEAIKRHPNDLLAHIGKAESWMKLGENGKASDTFDQALSICNVALQQNPNSIQLLSIRDRITDSISAGRRQDSQVRKQWDMTDIFWQEIKESRQIKAEKLTEAREKIKQDMENRQIRLKDTKQKIKKQFVLNDQNFSKAFNDFIKTGSEFKELSRLEDMEQQLADAVSLTLPSSIMRTTEKQMESLIQVIEAFGKERNEKLLRPLNKMIEDGKGIGIPTTSLEMLQSGLQKYSDEYQLNLYAGKTWFYWGSAVAIDRYVNRRLNASNTIPQWVGNFIKIPSRVGIVISGIGAITLGGMVGIRRLHELSEFKDSEKKKLDWYLLNVAPIIPASWMLWKWYIKPDNGSSKGKPGNGQNGQNNSPKVPPNNGGSLTASQHFFSGLLSRTSQRIEKMISLILPNSNIYNAFSLSEDRSRFIVNHLGIMKKIILRRIVHLRGSVTKTFLKTVKMTDLTNKPPVLFTFDKRLSNAYLELEKRVTAFGWTLQLWYSEEAHVWTTKTVISDQWSVTSKGTSKTKDFALPLAADHLPLVTEVVVNVTTGMLKALAEWSKTVSSAGMNLLLDEIVWHERLELNGISHGNALSYAHPILRGFLRDLDWRYLQTVNKINDIKIIEEAVGKRFPESERQDKREEYPMTTLDSNITAEIEMLKKMAEIIAQSQ